MRACPFIADKQLQQTTGRCGAVPYDSGMALPSSHSRAAHARGGKSISEMSPASEGYVTLNSPGDEAGSPLSRRLPRRPRQRVDRERRGSAFADRIVSGAGANVLEGATAAHV